MKIEEIQEIQTNLMNLKHYNIAPNVLTKAANGLEELKSYKELDLEIPQHFTKEQSDWIKKYCIERNNEFYKQGVDDLKNELLEICAGYNSTYDSQIICVAEHLKGGIENDD